MISRYFLDEEVNTGRQAEFDVARTFSIIGMIITHCYETSGIPLNTGFAYWITTLMGSFLGAPLFMFYMGAATRYSKNSDPAALAKRGLIIFGLAYALNVFRRFLPNVIIHFVYGYELPASYFILQLCAEDILQFAGLALIALAVIKKLEVSDFLVVMIGVLLSLVGMLTCGIDLGSQIANAFGGVFLGTMLDGASGGYFSFVHYFIFVACGYVYGNFWKRCTDKAGFFKRFSPICAIIGGIGFALEIFLGIGVVGSGDLTLYYYIGLPDAIICFFNAIAMSGVYYLLHLICGEHFNNFCYTFSSGIGVIYITHLILVRWVIYLVMQTFMDIEMTAVSALVVAVCLTVFCYYFVLWFNKRFE